MNVFDSLLNEKVIYKALYDPYILVYYLLF